MTEYRDWEDEVDRLFNEALEIEPDGREAFLAEQCRDRDDLRREVLGLLDQDRLSEGFLERPALDEQARAVAQGGTGLFPGGRFGSREVVDLLGVGGMGAVYQVHSPATGKSEALKVLPPYFLNNPKQVQRFKREARTLAALRHPGIVEVREIGEEDGLPYFTMEMVGGETLASLLASGPLPVEMVIDYAIQIADAVGAAHRKGVIHRDIKASNVIVTPDGRTKLLDFGLSKFKPAPEAQISGMSADSLTRTGAVMGTLHSMSPEQARGEKVDRRTDIFSLGVLIYQMATGRLPFQGGTAPETIHHICNTRPLPIARYSLEASEELEDIVRRCLQKEPSKRYSTVQALVDDLRGWKKPGPRRTVLWLSLSGAVLLILALLLLAIW